MTTMRVLLVDDEEEFVVTLSERLGLRGMDADYATSADEALMKAQNQFYDVAVLDMRLPKMGGLAIRDALKGRHPDMKFLFLTGYGSEEDFNNVASLEGNSAYLVKPIGITTLIAKINELFIGKGGRNE